MKMTRHAIVDRIDRLMYIAQTIGFGEIIAEEIHNGGRECLTDSGVILVKAIDEERLITAWIADLDRALAIYRGAGKGNTLPRTIANKIKNNSKHRHQCK
jgi:hypothetical protein